MFKSVNTLVIFFLMACLSSFYSYAKSNTGTTLLVDNGAYVISSAEHKIRLTPYGNAMIRLQSARTAEEFFSDEHYEMVVTHQWPREMSVTEHLSYWLFTLKNSSSNLADSQAVRKTASQTEKQNTITVRINKNTLAATFTQNRKVVLTQSQPTQWNGNKIITSFIYDKEEHFTGLGLSLIHI